ncbi:MAG TPA: cytochrome c oxidase subunit 3 [Geminicoccus sp.]|uniref:cytochrome c oxidase subunit 3 n=1 Tax=Geminicoccus sp. TaxID=2024832 RepID=UPI002CD14354|nr:cytochrome c oxidase subunit 3 [Geminicoccus sp.]HWL69534.1 cytochrome c oxidase subunit 3 [Geminicoccus sp.]
MTEQVQVHDPYQEAGQQHEADMMGMYLFLATELMLFGGLCIVIVIYRFLHPEEVVAASARLHLWIGAINTVVLLTSSLAVAAAVHLARRARAGPAATWLLAAVGLGLAFLGLKAQEYHAEYREGQLPILSDPPQFAGPVEQLFMNLYLFATALHAIHLTIGIALVSGLSWLLLKRRIALPQQAVRVEVCGLYWHLVDIVWVFLYPILYLAR